MSPAVTAGPAGDLRGLVEEYLEHLAARRRPKTVAARRTVLERVFLPWVEAQGVRELDGVTPGLLDRWSRHLQTEPGALGRPLSEVTVATYCREVNIWLRWAAKGSGLRAESPQLLPRTIEVLTREEMLSMEKACTTDRDKLIVRVLADTGIRAGELVNLHAEDVVREEGRSYLRVRGKRGGRFVPIDAGLYRRLHAFADGRQGPFFVSSRGKPRKPLTEGGVRQVVQDAGTLAGITKPVTTHLLRHSFATWYLNASGGDALTLRRNLGHASTKMIDQVYVHLANHDRHDSMMRLLKGGK